MNRGQKLLCRVCLITAVSCLMIQTPAYAGTWISGEHGEWAYLSQEGARVKGWIFDETDREWYFLNDSGIMLASTWICHTDGRWYYLEASGAMGTNAWIAGQDGKWYYVGSDGAMLTSMVTPDGYTVAPAGVWDARIPKKTVPAARTKGRGSGGGGTSYSKGNSYGSGSAGSGEKAENANDGGLSEVPDKNLPLELPVATYQRRKRQPRLKQGTMILQKALWMNILPKLGYVDHDGDSICDCCGSHGGRYPDAGIGWAELSVPLY